MVANAIKPYQDEILFSIIARYTYLYSTKGPKQLLPSLYGRSTISATLDLPSGISTLSRSMVLNGLSSYEIIMNHTLYPLYCPFISVKKRNLVLKSMNNKSGDVHTRIGLNAGSIKRINYPRYCPKCYIEDLQSQYNEPYFRRMHQISGVDLCITHNLKLHNADSLIYNYNKHAFLSLYEIEFRKDHIENKNFELLQISKEIVDLLHNINVHNYNNEPYFYNKRVKEVGFIKGQMSVDIQKLYAEFTSYYQQHTLKDLQSEVDFNDESCWLKLAVRKRRKDINPIRHILLLNFIKHFNNKSQIYASDLKKNCRNPVCLNYNTNRKTKTSYKIDPKSKREIAHVVCSCGFHYTESFNCNKNILNRSVREFGKLWIFELNRLLSEKLPIREIARRLKCDSKTVLFRSKATDKVNNDRQIKLIKAEWNKLKKDYPHYSITELRKLKPGLYAFLYRNDKDWLLKLKYTKVKNFEKIPERINWVERDKEWAAIMNYKLKELKNSGFKNRISRSLLLKLIKHESTIRKNLKKLPNCSLFIEKNEESLQEYRKRRILREAHSMIEHNYVITAWRLIKKAGIRKEHLNKELEMMIESLIEDSKNVLSMALAS